MISDNKNSDNSHNSISPERIDDFRVLYHALIKAYNKKKYNDQIFKSNQNNVLSKKSNSETNGKFIVFEPQKKETYLEKDLGNESESLLLSKEDKEPLSKTAISDTIKNQKKRIILPSEINPINKDDSLEKQEKMISQKLKNIDLSAITMPPNYNKLKTKDSTENLDFGDLFRKKAILVELEDELNSVRTDINSLISATRPKKRASKKEKQTASEETKKLTSLKDYIKKLKSKIKERRQMIQKLLKKIESKQKH